MTSSSQRRHEPEHRPPHRHRPPQQHPHDRRQVENDRSGRLPGGEGYRQPEQRDEYGSRRNEDNHGSNTGYGRQERQFENPSYGGPGGYGRQEDPNYIPGGYGGGGRREDGSYSSGGFKGGSWKSLMALEDMEEDQVNKNLKG